MPRSGKKKRNGRAMTSIVGQPPSPPTVFPDDIPSAVLDGSTSLMVQKAIASAARHGIQLVPGRANPAIGDCSFEAAIFNVNDRECFMENFSMSIDYYRRLWTIDMENRLFETDLNPGYSYADWHAGWARLRESKIYEVDYFGDLVIPAIACGLKKILLIFNTNTNNPRTPLSVIDPAKFGVNPSSEIPVVLAYNLSHYESLHPSTDQDIEKCVDLVISMHDGRYSFGYNDLAWLVSLQNIPHVEKLHKINFKNRKISKKVEVKIVTELENITDLPSKKTPRGKKRKLSDEPDVFEFVEQAKKIKFRDMTGEEKQHYWRQKYKERMERKSQKGKEEIRNKWTESKASERKKKKEENETEFKKKVSDEKAKTSEKKRKQNEKEYKKKAVDKKAKARGTKRNQNEKELRDTMALEKARNRTERRKENEPLLRDMMATEKARDRAEKRQENEPLLRDMMAAEKARDRDEKRKGN